MHPLQGEAVAEVQRCSQWAKPAPDKNPPPPVQEPLLTGLSFRQTAVTLVLMSGVSVQGKIVWFDDYGLLLWTSAGTHLIHKRAIAYLLPSGPSRLMASPDDHALEEEAPGRLVPLDAEAPLASGKHADG